jgi:5-formyltetrahydrofolate cyclo-ligase
VPALAFDELGYRLGYGGGFYDVFLADFPGISIGLGRQAQMMDDFSACGVREACDVPVDLVVTEEGLL